MTGKEKPPARKTAPKTTPKDADTPEGERIAKVLSRAGIASRREAERLIELGEVKVNGKVITSPALNVTAKDKITVRGEPVAEPEPPRLWLYYKPEGLVTSASDEKGRDTVFDHLPEDMPRVMSVGRLDLNSEGLLLLTNDGELKRRLELPSTGWLRKYRVRVKGNPTDPDLEPLRKGVVVDGEKFQGMEVRLDRHQGANAWLTVGLREGKNREIRRAMNHIGLTVNRLIRTSYGPFRLNELQPGEVEEVKARVLRDQLGLKDEGEEKSAPGARRSSPPATGRGAGGEGQAKVSRTAKSAPEAGAKPAGKRLKPGEGLKQLSEAWTKATRPSAHKASDRATAERPKSERPKSDRPAAGRPTTTRPTRTGGPRPGPGPGSGPKKG